MSDKVGSYSYGQVLCYVELLTNMLYRLVQASVFDNLQVQMVRVVVNSSVLHENEHDLFSSVV